MVACAWQWILLELPLMSSSAFPADPAEGCVIADAPGFPALKDHEPVYDCWPLRKGLHRSRLGPDSYVHLRPTTAWVPRASAAIASALVMPESPCLLPAL